MLGKTVAAVVVAAFIAVVPTTAAIAANSHTADEPSPSPTSTYVPGQHSAPSLDGSAVSSACIGDVPYIDYSVVLNDPDNVATGHTATLIMSGGGNTTSIPLGTLDSSNQLSGTVLWPGASVDSQGNADGWPGWALVDGVWVETTGNFAWTRGPITAVIQVNPELTVPLSYPPSTAACASPSGSHDPEPAALAATGSDFNPTPLLFAGGALVVLGGVAVVLVSRRAARRN
jgi:hypothetical protein